MKSLTRPKKKACCTPQAPQAPAPEAQCCAKVARSVAGCHD